MSDTGRIVRVTELLDMAASNAVWDANCQGRAVPDSASGSWRPVFGATTMAKETRMLDLDITATALVIIDLQEGILSPKPVPHGRDAIADRAAELGRVFAAANRPIVLTTTNCATGHADAPAGRADEPGNSRRRASRPSSPPWRPRSRHRPPPSG